MAPGLIIAAIGIAIMATVLGFPPTDESTRCTALIVFMLGQVFTALGACLMIRAHVTAMMAPSDGEEG